MKYLILVGDGMGDHPLDELDGKTPLEVAKTPAMDFVSNHGQLGRLQTVPDGYLPGSDVANLSLLGYRPEKVYTGRSPLEAASLGVHLADDEIAFRCNLVTLSERDSRIFMDDYSGGHIGTEDAGELIKAINENFSSDLITLYPGVSYRHLLVYKNIPAAINTVPPHDYTGKDVTAFWKEYEKIPPLQEFIQQANQTLTNHPFNKKRVDQGKRPANGVWLWGEGKSPAMPTLQERFGISGALISAVDLLKGIGVYAAMDVIDVPGATGYLDTNYQGKVSAALESLKQNDLVLVHVEAPDETGHQGLLKEKIQAIEDFDQKIVQPLLDGMDGSDFRMVVCMDHFTPVHLKTHVADPVPVALFDSRHPEQAANNGYSEASGRESQYFWENGEEFIKHVIS